MDRVGGSGAGGADGHRQVHNTVDHGAAVDPQFVILRQNVREQIFEYIGREPSSINWRRRVPELEEILFKKFPSKHEYHNMTKEPIEPHLQFAIKTLTARIQKVQMSTETASPSGYKMIPTPGIVQEARRNSGVYVTDSMDLLLPGTSMAPRNANMGLTQVARALSEPEPLSEAVLREPANLASSIWNVDDACANTLLPLGMKRSRHDHSRLPDNPLIYIVDTPETNDILPQVAQALTEPAKKLRRELPKFSCPVCMSDLVDASSTVCGHIFCQACIKASIKAQKKCPTCRRKLTMRNFHRVYLPIMD